MRIISGTLKGKNILPPQGYKARPTTDFARQGLFNVLDNEYDFEDLAVLDLFAGTGTVGFEFISRGAGKVVAVEINPENAAFISTSAEKLGVAGKMQIVRHNVFEFLPLCKLKFDIVFADPPYALSDLETLPDKVFAVDVLHPEGYFILEHPGTHTFERHPRFVKEKAYGNVHFSFFM